MNEFTGTVTRERVYGNGPGGQPLARMVIVGVFMCKWGYFHDGTHIGWAQARPGR